MIKIKNKFLRAIIGFILFTAVLHLVFLFAYTLFKLNVSLINYFDIIDLDLYFPSIIKGILSQVLSIITAITVFLVIYKIS